MVATGLKMLGLLAAGTGLGAVIAAYADPVPRQPRVETTQASGRPAFSGAQSYQFVDVGPENLAPPTPPSPADGYAPDWANGDEAAWQYQQPAFAAWEPTPLPAVAELDTQLGEDAALLDSAADSVRPAAGETGEILAAPEEAEAPARTEAHLAALY